MPRIALPNKGRLAADARELFSDAGLDVRVHGDRALTASLGGLFEAIFVRAADIPEFVADGAADLGVTGWDLIQESGRDVESLLDLELGRCRLVAAATEYGDVRSVGDVPAGARVATTFPRLAARFFGGAARDVVIVPVSGAAEIAPHIGVADVIVDLVSTGSTLRVNGLREIDTILASSARLVASRGTAGAVRAGDPAVGTIVELLAALESVVRAKGQRYVMANVPRSLIADARRVLPGLGGPTVLDISNGCDQVAMHAVVPAAQVYHVIGGLRALGASGILVTRIERLIP